MKRPCAIAAPTVVVVGPFDTAVGRTPVLADPAGAQFSVTRTGPPAQ